MDRGLMLYIVSVVVALAVPAQAVVGGAPASPPEPDAAVVFTQLHGYSARIEGVKDDKLGYYSFYGIRYAEPPLGPQRFQRPIRRYLAGEMMALKQCQPCPQRDPYVAQRVIGDEDCLCLNVFAPKMPEAEEGSPVVFFIHGGNYKSGSSSTYGGQHLAQKDTILVTAQYRLGSLGYLSTGQKDAGGNLGLFDLHTVMVWIKDYIQFFGGDPKRVVVMGQGSGGSAASLLALSPEGRSATGVAALSGAPLSPGAVRPDPAKHAEAIAERTGCPKKPAESLIICLRKQPHQKIVLADEELNADDMMDTQKFLDDVAGRSGAGARVEGQDDLRGLPPLVAEPPADSLKKKEERVPMLTGVTSAETSRAVFGKYNKFLTNKLKNAKDFIQKDLVGGLKNVVQDVSGLIPFGNEVQGLLSVTDYYTTGLIDAGFSIADGLAKVAEATGDALFNLPAFESVQQWGGGGGKAFLYSFEHVGNLSKGWHFLPGVPLAEKADDGNGSTPVPQKVTGPSHGDELAYIFEPLGPDGQPVGEDVSGMDARVRENFVQLISSFAHGVDEDKDAKKNGSRGASVFNTLLMGGDGGKNNQFLKIGDEITIDKDFRFCQLGLWGNIADRLTGPLCQQIFSGLLSGVPLGEIGKQTQGLANQLTQPGQQLTQLVPGQGGQQLLPGQQLTQLVPGQGGQQQLLPTQQLTQLVPGQGNQQTQKPPGQPLTQLFPGQGGQPAIHNSQPQMLPGLGLGLLGSGNQNRRPATRTTQRPRPRALDLPYDF